MIESLWHEIATAAPAWFAFDPKAPLLFNSALFLGMFLVFYPLYILTLRAKTPMLRNFYVVAFSLFFYYKSSGVFFVLLLFSSVSDYHLGNLLYAEARVKMRKFYLWLSMVLNLSFLGYFKYTNFLIDNYNGLFSGNVAFHDIILPVGISFYTFQSMSYIIDIYRRELTPTKTLLDYVFFVSFFPQLVAGPIVRAAEFLPQMYRKVTLSRADLNAALFLIIGGLIKKTVISDYVSVNFVDRVFDAPNSYTAFENLMAAYGYTIQIYCDFSGYSDIAIGIAMLLGFQLPVNFRTPYKSRSVTEFWRRWHISLSRWLRDYLYISLGGNRKGKARTYVNLFLTMVIGGLWHGASWKFVVWGVLHGSALVVERLFKGKIRWPKNRISAGVQWLLTLHFVVFCWIFFRAKDFQTAFELIANIANLEWAPQHWWAMALAYRNIFLLMLIGYLWHFLPEKWSDGLHRNFNALPVLGKSFVMALVFWLLYATAVSGPQPFIYFQF